MTSRASINAVFGQREPCYPPAIIVSVPSTCGTASSPSVFTNAWIYRDIAYSSSTIGMQAVATRSMSARSKRTSCRRLPPSWTLAESAWSALSGSSTIAAQCIRL